MCERRFHDSEFCLRICTVVLSLWLTGFLTVPEVKAGEKTTITSETVTALNKEQKAIFRGSVVMTQGDLVVRSDVMIVSFKAKKKQKADPSAEKGTNGNPQVDRIEARGKVVIERAAGRAVCRKAIYYKDEEKIVLTGSPVAWQDGTRVSGLKMTLFLKENRSVVEGQSRVVIVDQEGTLVR